VEETRRQLENAGRRESPNGCGRRKRPAVRPIGKISESALCLISLCVGFARAFIVTCLYAGNGKRLADSSRRGGENRNHGFVFFQQLFLPISCRTVSVTCGSANRLAALIQTPDRTVVYLHSIILIYFISARDAPSTAFSGCSGVHPGCVARHVMEIWNVCSTAATCWRACEGDHGQWCPWSQVAYVYR